ncbi:MFS transporter [uncultured Serinicoccus sp.]|uniref:MFS transporter n=1 Tax=uncultured Serinicoccus sp. TaxID=735514 RepID=UPI002617B6D2|nr:MFS transporter [uncultured Serinicoccus sp.]
MAAAPPEGAPSGGRLLTGAFVALVLAELAYFIGIGALIPLVPLYAADRLDAGPLAVGLTVAAFSITALVLRPAAGRVVDRWGPRRPFVAGALLLAAVLLAHTLVGSLAGLLALRVLTGVAEAVVFVAGMAALLDITPSTRRGEALSYSSLSLFVGVAVGPAIGEGLLGLGGYRAAWLGVAGIGLLAAVIGSALPGRPADAAPAGSTALFPRSVRLPGLAFAGGVAGSAGFLAFAALRARDVGLDGAAWPLAVYGGVVVVGRLLLARLTDRWAATRLSAAALGLTGAGLLLLGAARGAPAFGVGTVVLALGAVLLTPAFFRMLTERMPADRPGAVGATFGVLVDLGLGAGPVVLGLLAQGLGLRGAFAVLGAGALLGVLLLTGGGRGTIAAR